jgi:hypothetical protein
MLEIELISTSDGPHKICFGLDAGEISSFGVQLYLTKYGKQAVDWVERLSLGWISFLRGDLWIQNSPDADRNEFFTEHKDAVVGVVVNEQPDMVKILDSIGIHTNKEWEVTSVTIPESLNYPDGMSSRIPKEKFKKREGVFRSEFLRNELSTNGTANVLDLLRGEEMRGEAAIIELTNTSTDEVRLFKISVDMTSSTI